MPVVIECVGHPRDMGLSQGLACRVATQERVARAGLPVGRSRLASLRPFTSGAVLGSGAGREIVRHYPHLSERMDGLARSAGVSLDSLMELHLQALGEVPDSEFSSEVTLSLGSVGSNPDGNVLLHRTLPQVERPGSSWLVRRSRPEVGFCSLDVTLPWLVSAVAGVNEAGLCASLVARSLEAKDCSASRAAAPPSPLLVQECLQRFRDVEASLDWCLNRPTSGSAVLILADEKAGMVGVEFSRGAPRVVQPEDGLLLTTPRPARLAGFREQVLRDGPPDFDSLGRFVARLPESDPAPSACLRLDCARRSLELRCLTGKRAEIMLEV